ncbi:MAG: phosphotransferase [Armatimonadota bacterium]
MSADIRYILLALVTFFAGVILTREIRRGFARFRSREQKAGKELIYRHFPRQKKPLGGGMAIFAALGVGFLLAFLFRLPVPDTAWLWLLSGIAFAGIGFIDDWRKVNAAQGLNEWSKLLLQALAAFICTWFIVSLRVVEFQDPTSVFIPFVGWLRLGVLFLPFGMLVIVAAANAVNLTDGLDGLAGSSLWLSYASYLVLGSLLQHESIPPLIPVLALAALAAFLFYNRPPAKIIMGDTGALGLGGALGVLGLISGTEWLLLLFAAPFVIDTVSVIIQVTVIKFFRGPVQLLRHQTTEVFRPFLCTPLHHHFQWLTWGPWPILALFCALGLFSGLLGVLAYHAANGVLAYGWLWLAGLLLQVGVLVFAALQKMVRANYFLGLERVETTNERMLALYKGLPMQVLGARWYHLEEVTGISESMVSTIAAESILWRNISEIEARATLGKIYAEYRMFDRAAEEWEEIPLRNLLIRETLVVQLGKIYFGREELLRAIKLWEQLPPARLAQIPGLLETIQSAKVRVGHLAGRLYHQARDHAAALKARAAQPSRMPGPTEMAGLIAELEGALRYTQELRDLLAHEQHKAEGAGELADTGTDASLYRRMDAMLASRREELHAALDWAQGETAPSEATPERTALQELAQTLHMTAAEMGRALEVSGELPVRFFERIAKPSRNTLYRIELEVGDARLPERLVAKCYEESQVTFFSACYRRERGVLHILQEADAPVPRVFGGHLGSHNAVLFLEDLGANDLSQALKELAPENRGGRMDLLRRGLETLATLHVDALSVLPTLEREIGKIVKEVLTPEYYLNTTTIALNRILTLERRQLSAPERGRLEVALRPLIAAMQDAPKTFIHFEYNPSNLLIFDGHIAAVDFEQSTLGPAATDVATLLYNPEANLSDDDVDELVGFYHDLLPPSALPALTVDRETLHAAAVLKMLFYAGSAANFYRKFEEGYRLTAMEWYLQTADRLLARYPDYSDLSEVLTRSWSGQQHLEV